MFFNTVNTLSMSNQFQTIVSSYPSTSKQNKRSKNKWETPRKRCTGFSYFGPKLYNVIPKDIKEAKTTDDFKT